MNSRDDRAGFCEFGRQIAHPCEPHLIDREILSKEWRSDLYVGRNNIFHINQKTSEGARQFMKHPG